MTPSTRRRLRLAVQLAGTTAGFTWIALSVDLRAVLGSVRALPLASFLGAVLLAAFGLFVGAVRWRVLLVAYGAPAVPPLARLTRLYVVGYFYNTYLPGGVGGDVIRGVVTREAFGESGMTRALTVVLVERVLGMAGLLTLVAGLLALRPPAGLEDVAPFAALGVVAALVGTASIAFARRLAPQLAKVRWLAALARLAASLPTLARPGAFSLAFLLSLVTQSVVALGGWVVLVGLVPGFPLGDAFLLVPLASATAFLPFTVGGAGAREAAFVAVGGFISLGATEATAASLLVWAAQLVVAAFGGLSQLVSPIASGRAEVEPGEVEPGEVERREVERGAS